MLRISSRPAIAILLQGIGYHAPSPSLLFRARMPQCHVIVILVELRQVLVCCRSQCEVKDDLDNCLTFLHDVGVLCLRVDDAAAQATHLVPDGASSEDLNELPLGIEAIFAKPGR